MALPSPHRSVSVLFILVCCLCSSRVLADLAADTNGLMMLKSVLDPGNNLNWSTSVNVCKWGGVQCNTATQRVVSVRLPGTSLIGSIPLGSIGNLTEVRVISLRSNRISGTLPADLVNCKFMRSIYLQNNRLSGELPPDFTYWPNLVHLDLSGNNFTGPMPASLGNLTQLKSLFLQNNSLEGELPPVNWASLTNFSVAYNKLNGSIPSTQTYRKFNKSSFIGNSLCGLVLGPCPGSPAPSPGLNPAPTSSHKRKLSGGAIAGIVIGAVVLILLLCLACILLRRKAGDKEPKANPYAASRSVEGGGVVEPATIAKAEGVAAVAASTSTDPNKLVFFEGDKYSFDLEDLLRASAEVLGKGSVGTAYKAVLENGAILAVKRLKEVTIEKRDFEQHVDAIGKLRNDHLVPLVAYYYSKEEKLLVYEYMTNGSLSALLHGNKGANRTPLNWDTRVEIALGTALGIDYLHDRGTIHGNIKSSNILLTNNYRSCISDYGLVQLVSATPAANRIVGYRAPEVTDIRRINDKADVYSYGMLLLELLTGKPPQTSTSNDGVDLPRWVQSVVREEWTAEVFDRELMQYQYSEDNMVELLQLAMECVSPAPDRRPTIKQVIERVEKLLRNDEIDI